jgi:hypothetical protein
VARDEPIAISDYGAQLSEAKLISRGVRKLELTFGTWVVKKHRKLRLEGPQGTRHAAASLRQLGR